MVGNSGVPAEFDGSGDAIEDDKRRRFISTDLPPLLFQFGLNQLRPNLTVGSLTDVTRVATIPFFHYDMMPLVLKQVAITLLRLVLPQQVGFSDLKVQMMYRRSRGNTWR